MNTSEQEPCYFLRPKNDLLWKLWNFGPYFVLKKPIYDHIVKSELLCLFQALILQDLWLSHSTISRDETCHS